MVGCNSLSGTRFAFFSHSDANLYLFRLPIMQALLAQGAQVWAIAPPGEHGPCFPEHGIHFVSFPIDRTTFNPLKAWRTVKQLGQAVEQVQADVLHTFTLRPNLYGAIAGWRIRVPVVIATVTGLGSLYTDDGTKTRLARFAVEQATRWALRAVDAVVFQNPDDRRYYLERCLCRPVQARLILSSGVDVGVFAPERISPARAAAIRQQWGILPHEVVVTMVSRLIAPKGVREFLAAAERLQGQARFVLIGEPDPGNPQSLTWEEVERYARCGVVVAPGRQEHVEEWLAISHIYVLPSYREGVPRTVLEAMGMGLPVVSTEVPGCREAVVDGETGFLVPPRDVDALVQAIQRLVEDPALRREMGRRGRERAVKRFSAEHVVAQYLALYFELLTAKVETLRQKAGGPS